MSVSAYSIHDLSRMEPLKTNDYPRFNMPFECGIDLSAHPHGPAKIRSAVFVFAGEMEAAQGANALSPHLQTLHDPPFLAQFLQYLQFLQALQVPVELQVASTSVALAKGF